MNLLIILMLTNFLKTLFILVIIYYAIKFIARYVFPLLLDKGIKNMQNKIYEQQRENQRQRRQPGDVTIEYGNQNPVGKSPKRGEYVDFEEVE